jgi:FkbM family methyltransferase
LTDGKTTAISRRTAIGMRAMRIKAAILRSAQLLLARRSLQRFNNLLFWTAMGGMGLGLYDPGQKDERCLLRKLRIRLGKCPVVFDIGANIGQYAKMVRQEYPDAVIYSFEPSPAAFSRLAMLAQALRFTAVNMACGDSIGTGVLFDRAAEGGSQHATLIPGIIESVHQSATLSTRQVPVTTVDVHMAEKGVDYVHLLKIDVEGFELEVLRDELAIAYLHARFRGTLARLSSIPVAPQRRAPQPFDGAGSKEEYLRLSEYRRIARASEAVCQRCLSYGNDVPVAEATAIRHRTMAMMQSRCNSAVAIAQARSN